MRYRLACALVVLALSAPVSAQFENVGTISFPTSGSPQAQPHFLRGVAILHSFGWKQAIAEFKLAQKAQPDFAMAYWGETLCYNHPLQGGTGWEEPAGGAEAPGAGHRGAPREGADAAREGLPPGGRGALGRRRLAEAPRRLHERDGAALQTIPRRRRGQDVLCAVAA